MRQHIRRLGPKSWFLCGFAVWLLVLAIVRANVPAPTAPASPARISAPASNPSHVNGQTGTMPAKNAGNGAAYVGDETCATCHGPENDKYVKTAHHRSADPRTPAAAKGCETCHGPGSQHITDPAANPLKNFKKMSSDDVNATCATCHNRGEHALWDGSTHQVRGLACITCHSIHAFESEKGQLKRKTQMELCATCHRDKVAKLMQTGHMPVREGKLECSSCHNTHGSTNVRLLKVGDSVAELCTSCHAEKRGPYLWEHAPVREGCATCHDPHGSSNERMLVAKLPMLCQRCHVSTRHPATIYDQTQLLGMSNRLLSRACVNCHAAIHGSNHPAGQFYLR